MIKRSSIIMPLLIAMSLFIGIVSAQNTNNSLTSNSLSGIVCQAWNDTLAPYRDLIIGLLLMLSFGIIGYEVFIRVHMAHLATDQGSTGSGGGGNELSLVMSKTMTVIIATLIIVGAIIAMFTIVPAMICK